MTVPGPRSPAPIVVKLGGRALEHPEAGAELFAALALLARRLDGALVIVHGGGATLDQHLARLHFPTRRVQGLRATPPEQMPEVTAVLAGRVNKSLVGALRRAGASPVGLCLGDGAILPVAPLEIAGEDLGRVGRIPAPGTTHPGPTAPPRAELLRTLLQARYLPVLSSVAIDDDGLEWNVNADDAAAAVAQALSARALVLLTDVPGIRDEQGRTIPEIDREGIERLIEAGVISGGMIPKARAALEAACAAGAPAVIAPWNDPSRLPDLASGAPVGTRIRPG